MGVRYQWLCWELDERGHAAKKGHMYMYMYMYASRPRSALLSYRVNRPYPTVREGFWKHGSFFFFDRYQKLVVVVALREPPTGKVPGI